MPPWHADRQYGTFRNDLSLTQTRDRHDREVGGRRRAAKAIRRACRALPKFPEGWQIGTPDVVFEMPAAYQIPAKGEIDYQYFEVPTNFTEDRWMQAGEVRAGDRAHVHHIIVYVREPTPTPRPNVMVNRPIASPRQPGALRPRRWRRPRRVRPRLARSRPRGTPSRAPAIRCS